MIKKKLFIADDHLIFREGLKMILEKCPDLEIIGEAGDGRTCLEKVIGLKPDFAILDISMPEMNGLEVAREIKNQAPEIKIIMLSRHDDVHHINQALKSGADGYVLKDEASDDLKEAIQLVGSGQMYFSPRVASHMIKGHKMREHTKYHVPEDAGNPVTGLTQREKEILILVAQAKNTKEIAAELTLSPSTVKAHRNNIMKKLNIHKVVDLVRFAIRSGYVDN